jgi:hypothetical protein
VQCTYICTLQTLHRPNIILTCSILLRNLNGVYQNSLVFYQIGLSYHSSIPRSNCLRRCLLPQPKQSGNECAYVTVKCGMWTSEELVLFCFDLRWVRSVLCIYTCTMLLSAYGHKILFKLLHMMVLLILHNTFYINNFVLTGRCICIGNVSAIL